MSLGSSLGNHLDNIPKFQLYFSIKQTGICHIFIISSQVIVFYNIIILGSGKPRKINVGFTNVKAVDKRLQVSTN